MPSAARRAGAAWSAGLGLVLVLAPLAAMVHAEESPATTVERVHVVEPGETLAQIAAVAGTDTEALVRLNGLDDPNLLSIGQKLELRESIGLPAAAATGTTYTVAQGDTLWAIAQQFSTSVAALVSANGLDDPDHVSAGVQLTIPRDGETAAPSVRPSVPTGSATHSPSVTPSRAAGGDGVSAPGVAAKRSLLASYTVQPGETLNRIARQFGVSSAAIAQASGLDDPNRIAIGSVLKVPLPGTEHVVKSGETLRDIARQAKVDLGTLIDFNALDDPELIHVGQVVLVPTPTGTPPAAAAAGGPTSASAPAHAAGEQAAQVGQPAQAAPSAPTQAAQAATSASAPLAAAANKPVAPKPAAPLAVVARPPGAPSDGLAGAALKFLGAPYVWGGSSPRGFDCSGLVWYVARQIGKPLSRGMFGQYNSGSHPRRDELKPGDMVFFQNTYTRGLSHNGVYIGNNQFVHAADEAAGVTISSLTTAYWSSHWFGATRLP